MIACASADAASTVAAVELAGLRGGRLRRPGLARDGPARLVQAREPLLQRSTLHPHPLRGRSLGREGALEPGDAGTCRDERVLRLGGGQLGRRPPGGFVPPAADERRPRDRRPGEKRGNDRQPARWPPHGGPAEANERRCPVGLLVARQGSGHGTPSDTRTSFAEPTPPLLSLGGLSARKEPGTTREAQRGYALTDPRPRGARRMAGRARVLPAHAARAGRAPARRRPRRRGRRCSRACAASGPSSPYLRRRLDVAARRVAETLPGRKAYLRLSHALARARRRAAHGRAARRGRAPARRLAAGLRGSAAARAAPARARRAGRAGRARGAAPRP